ncbi:protein kinase [Chitinophaga sp. Hz27]|uniref:protein kinase domain-containing protein n=1 Tax=Chitinophaga sp. Hz27 TaxID=3347169 RepID=UPI0035E20006
MNGEVSFPSSIQNDQYTVIIEQSGRTYNTSGHLISVGKKKQFSGWVILLSSVQHEVSGFLPSILPFLLEKEWAFEIPLSPLTSKKFINGDYGLERMGTVVTIFPENDEQAIEIINSIQGRTTSCNYTTIPKSIHIINNIFVRKAEFNAIEAQSQDGTPLWLVINIDNSISPQNLEHYDGDTKDWPFTGFLKEKPVRISNPKIIKDKVIVTKKIREAFKGNVYKGLYFKNLFKPIWCLIKEGKSNYFVNAHNKDARDNIEWHYKIISKLKTEKITNIPFDLIHDNDVSYIITSYLRGEEINYTITKIYSIKSWEELTSENKNKLFKLLLQCIDIIATLHHHNIIHRDISSNNFLVKKENVKIIDFSLSYDQTDPDGSKSSFWGRTMGFSERNKTEAQLETPDKAEDIYSLGCLMIYILTGIYPSLLTGNNDRLLSDLSQHINNPTILNIINRCIGDSHNRPTILEIAEEMKKISVSLHGDSRGKQEFYEKDKTLENLEKLIRFSTSPDYLDEKGRWTSVFNSTASGVITSKTDRQVSPWLQTGISGIMLCLSDSIVQDTLRSKLQNVMQVNADVLFNTVASHEKVLKGLFTGVYGIPTALSYAVSNHLLDITPEKINSIFDSMIDLERKNLTLADGLSGLGLSMLLSNSFLPGCVPDKSAQKINAEILSNCEKINKSHRDFFLHFNANDLGQGGIGVIFYLLKYSNTYKDSFVQLFCQEKLEWLNSHPMHFPGNRSLTNGNLGLSILFLNGYNILNDNRHLKAGIKILNETINNFSKNDLGYANGIAGLGHCLLDTFHATSDEKWFQIAKSIKSYFDKLLIHHPDSSAYWYSDIAQNVSFDFFYGIGGIISFYNRFNNIQHSKGFHLLQ